MILTSAMGAEGAKAKTKSVKRPAAKASPPTPKRSYPSSRALRDVADRGTKLTGAFLELSEVFGGVESLAEKLDRTPNTVRAWHDRWLNGTLPGYAWQQLQALGMPFNIAVPKSGA